MLLIIPVVCFTMIVGATAECCQKKVVKDFTDPSLIGTYYLNKYKTYSECKDDCVYTKDDSPGNLYCFAEVPIEDTAEVNCTLTISQEEIDAAKATLAKLNEAENLLLAIAELVANLGRRKRDAVDDAVADGTLCDKIVEWMNTAAAATDITVKVEYFLLVKAGLERAGATCTSIKSTLQAKVSAEKVKVQKEKIRVQAMIPPPEPTTEADKTTIHSTITEDASPTYPSTTTDTPLTTTTELPTTTTTATPAEAYTSTIHPLITEDTSPTYPSTTTDTPLTTTTELPTTTTTATPAEAYTSTIHPLITEDTSPTYPSTTTDTPLTTTTELPTKTTTATPAEAYTTTIHPITIGETLVDLTDSATTTEA
ncbi:mucin-5AC [Eurytemora carolleeae]|uniref:mucin-5AC n=1 Tax=Eurytemora carolleeae TaxID=1294199 RepID=UPI000C77CBD7|nr:mucin-5AC [Eurytemora carolleeae]|eukprot:XP_023347670.1 mucin-5AC-like [Eurytemora affinis]